MSPTRFEHLLALVAPHITKKDTNFRKAIPAQERLALTLRFLASGESQISLSFSFRIGHRTVGRIINETCDAIYNTLLEQYMSAPNNEEEWKRIAEEFKELWQLPHVIGAIDGKHVQIEAPPGSGSLFHNYKGFFSIVLLALCDAKYRFTLIDIGQYGSNNDTSVFNKSRMGKAFQQGKMGLPNASPLKGFTLSSLPYYLVGDEIFALKSWLMKPYPGRRLEEEKSIFNYRLSRARRVIENAFGILRSRWRIYSHPIKGSVDNIIKYVLATLCLHNYLSVTENSSYCPTGLVDSENSDGVMKHGEWRSSDDGTSLKSIAARRGSRQNTDAVLIRNALKSYVNSVEGSLPWQLEHVRNDMDA